MKRVLILITVLISLSGVHSSIADSNFNLDFKIDGSVSIPSGFFITPSIRAMYDLGSFGAGAELKYTHNLKYNDSYILGFGIVEFGPFYGGMGFAGKLTDAHDQTGEYYFATSAFDVNIALWEGNLNAFLLENLFHAIRDVRDGIHPSPGLADPNSGL